MSKKPFPSVAGLNCIFPVVAYLLEKSAVLDYGRIAEIHKVIVLLYQKGNLNYKLGKITLNDLTQNCVQRRNKLVNVGCTLCLRSYLS
jgi:hypothetical protein